MNDIKRECWFYSHGGSISKGFTTYPTIYGARCEAFNEFFVNDGKHIKPDCETCLSFNPIKDKGQMLKMILNDYAYITQKFHDPRKKEMALKKSIDAINKLYE